MILATPPIARPHTRAPGTGPPPTGACPCAGYALGEPKRKKTQPRPGCTPPRALPAALPSSQPSPTEGCSRSRAQPDIWGSSSSLGAPQEQGRASAPCSHPWAHKDGEAEHN